MNGDFGRLIYLASAASGVVGGIVYVARQLVTKEDLKEVKSEFAKVMVTKDDLKEAKVDIKEEMVTKDDFKSVEKRLKSIEEILNGK